MSKKVGQALVTHLYIAYLNHQILSRFFLWSLRSGERKGLHGESVGDHRERNRTDDGVDRSGNLRERPRR